MAGVPLQERGHIRVIITVEAEAITDPGPQVEGRQGIHLGIGHLGARVAGHPVVFQGVGGLPVGQFLAQLGVRVGNQMHLMPDGPIVWIGGGEVAELLGMGQWQPQQ